MTARPHSPWALFDASCARHRERPALIIGGETITYGQLRERALAFAALAEPAGCRIGGVYLPNGPAFLEVMLGMNKLGTAFVSLSYQFKGDMLLELIDYTDLELLVTDARGYEAVREGLGRTNVRTVLRLREDGGYDVIPREDVPPSRELPGIGPDTFGICFTSGSTARPKGIVLSNAAVVGNAMAIAEHIGCTCEDRSIIPRSLAQASPLAGDVLMTLSQGGAIILLGSVFHPAAFLRAIEEYGATQFFTVRTMLQQAMEYPRFGSYDVSSVKRIMMGGMMNPPSVFQAAAAKFRNARIYNAYGASEAVARVTFGEHEDILSRPYAIGRPIQGCGLTILREDGTEAADYETGEFYIRSEYLMQGYYKQEALTREAMTPHGFRVRDTGYRDADGIYYALGRSDDVIVQGGTLAYPIDIEEALLGHPAVAEAVVAGVPDDRLGQRIVAFVCLKPEAGAAPRADARELHRWCLARLEDSKSPKEIHLVDAIPRNVIGKINKGEVLAAFRHLITQEEAI